MQIGCIRLDHIRCKESLNQQIQHGSMVSDFERFLYWHNNYNLASFQLNMDVIIAGHRT